VSYSIEHIQHFSEDWQTMVNTGLISDVTTVSLSAGATPKGRTMNAVKYDCSTLALNKLLYGAVNADAAIIISETTELIILIFHKRSRLVIVFSRGAGGHCTSLSTLLLCVVY
jgi:hypothetical protein